MVDPIDENYSETPDKFQENISEPSSTENLQEQEDLKDEYEFFRLLVKRNILKLTSITEQYTFSTWLHNCNMERNMSKKCGTIKLMLMLLQHTEGPLKYFDQTISEKLPNAVNTYNSIENLFFTFANKNDIADNYGKKGVNIMCRNVTAAVSADLTSFASTFADDSCVQVFYARSDHVINTWWLPEHVEFPRNSCSSARWERALSTSPPITSRTTAKPEIKKQITFKQPIIESTSKNDCPYDEVEQESFNVDSGKDPFKWYEHSRLDGYLRPMNDICIDKDICRHEKNQLDMDERAINVVNRVYPGRFKMVLDPVLIFNVTGIKTNQTDKGLNTHRMTLSIDAMNCRNANDQIILTSNTVYRPNAGEDRYVDAKTVTDQTIILDGILDIGELCPQRESCNKQNCIDTREIAEHQCDDTTTDTDRTTIPETELDIDQICKQNSKSCECLSSDSVVNDKDRLHDGEDIREDQYCVDTIAIEADKNFSQLISDINEFCDQISESCRELLNSENISLDESSESLEDIEKQLNDENDQCVDVITMESVHPTLNLEVQLENGKLCTQETRCVPSSNDSLLNSAVDFTNDKDDHCTNIIAMEVDRNIIQEDPSDGELCLKVSKHFGELSKESDSLVNPDYGEPDDAKTRCVDTIMVKADRTIGQVGPDAGELSKQTNGQQITILPQLSPWYIDYSTQLAGSSRASLQSSPLTVIVHRSLKCMHMHSGCSSSLFNVYRPRDSVSFGRRYYTRFSAGSDYFGRRWLMAKNDCYLSQRNNNYYLPEVRRPIPDWKVDKRRSKSSSPLNPAYRNRCTSAVSCRRQEPRRRTAAHGCGLVQEPCDNARSDWRATCDELPVSPCTRRNALSGHLSDGGGAFRRRTYDVPGVPTATQRKSVMDTNIGASGNTTIMVTGSINVVPEPLVEQPPTAESIPITCELYENYLDGIPRELAVPGPPFVHIDENAPYGRTPKHRRNPFDDWDLSGPMAFDTSREYGGNDYFQNDEHAAGAMEQGRCGRRRDNTFYRNTR